MNPIIMHINYTEPYDGKSLDDICRLAAELGFDGIEFRGYVPPYYSSLSFREYAEQIASAKKKHGLSEIVFGLRVFENSEQDEETREKSILTAIENTKIAREVCDSKIFNCFSLATFSKVPGLAWDDHKFHGSAAVSESAYNGLVESLSRIGEALIKIDAKLALETHMGYIHDTPEASMRLVNDIACPAVGINMDQGNVVNMPSPPSVSDTIDMYGDKLFYVHLKNSIPVPEIPEKRIPTSLAEGAINHRDYIKKLFEVGYEGSICIEAPRSGDRVFFAEQDLKYIKSVISSLR